KERRNPARPERMRPAVEDLPGDEGREHPHRTVCKVEDARGAVYEHDAERGEREDSAEAQADDRVRGERSHQLGLGADPAGGRMPPTAFVLGVREAVVWIVIASPIRERHRPSGLETLKRIERLDQ